MTNRILPLLVANWKANLPPGEEVLLAEKIANDAGRRGLLPGSLMIAPSALGLVPVASLLQRVHASLQIGLVAQDVSAQEAGAHTGETPATHLLGIAGAVIVGHSERRALGETGELIGRKVAFAIAAGLRPIICVGDTAREATIEQRVAEVREQWERVMVSAGQVGCNLGEIIQAETVVAYEPVWAIGSGESADPQLAGRMATAIREGSSEEMQVLYGGSVRAPQAADFFVGEGRSQIDGLLVGGASLSSEHLLDIAAALGSAT